MRILLGAFFLIASTICNAQNVGTAKKTITVVNNKMAPMSNTPVTLIETTTKERISQNTDGSGKVTFILTTGKEWAINILEMKNIKTIERNENGSSEGSMFVTYDMVKYERTHRPPVDRSKLKLEVIPANNEKKMPSVNNAVVRLHFLKEDKKALSNFPVNLTCYKTLKTYLGSTNKEGFATFLVPISNDYEIDIDGLESYNYIDIGGQSGTFNLELTYQPTTIKENIQNDTIEQNLSKTPGGASGRVSLKLKMNGGAQLGNEDVYLQMLKTNKVYKAKTNSNGEAFFLVPGKRKYMVHFRYQKDVDVLNYSDVQGISHAEVTLNYVPENQPSRNNNYVPKPEEVLAVDLIKFVDKQFPEPTNDEAIGLNVNWCNGINAQSKEAFLELGFTAKKDNGAMYGPPINIALVVDKSGSMEGHDRIDALKIALKGYVSKLRPSDRVALIVFDDKSTVIIHSQPAGDKRALIEMIEDIQAGGGTNIYNGMVDGYEEVLKHFVAKGTNRVVLLTDGYGVTPPEEIVKKSKEYNAKGIELSAVGIGDGYNLSMLTLLASTGGGLLHLAGEAKDMDKVFQKELHSVLNPIAKEVNIEIEYNNQIVFKQLYGFDTKAKTANIAQMKLDNIYSGLSKLALIKFSLNNPTKEIEKIAVIIRMKYFDLKKQKLVSIEKKAYLKWSPETGQVELLLEAQHKKLYAIAILNQSIKVISEAYAAGNEKAAKEAMGSAFNQYKSIYPNCNDQDVLDLVQAIDVYSNRMSAAIQSKTH